MAPRRGGGGGSSSGSTNNQCSELNAFGSPIEQSWISLKAISLLFFIVVFFMWLSKRKRNPKLKDLLGWTFGFSIIFQTLGISASIITFTLRACGVTNSRDYFQTSTISPWLQYIGLVLFFAVVIFSVIPALWDLVGSKTFVPKLTNGLGWGVYVPLVVAWLAIVTYYNVRASNISTSYYWGASLRNTASKLSAATSFIALILSVSILVFMVIPLTKMRAHGISSSSLKYLIPVFGFFLISYHLEIAVTVIYFDIQSGTTDQVGYIVEDVFYNVLNCMPYILLLILGGAPTFSAVPDSVAYTPAGKPHDSVYASYQLHHTVPPQQDPTQQPASTTQTYYNPVQVPPQNQWSGYNQVPSYHGTNMSPPPQQNRW